VLGRSDAVPEAALVTIDEAIHAAHISLLTGCMMIEGAKMRGAARIGILVLIGVLSAVADSYPESAETPTAESVMAQLTGSSWRVWVKKRWVMVLAEPPRCEAGEIWTFVHDGKGVKRTCVNGVARDEQFMWVWHGTEDDLPVLKIDETRYLAELRRQKAKVPGDAPVLVMVLRTPRTDQIKLVEEIILAFQDL
jgi:hypothetical protein